MDSLSQNKLGHDRPRGDSQRGDSSRIDSSRPDSLRGDNQRDGQPREDSLRDNSSRDSQPRQPDRIDTGPLFTDEQAIRLNRRFRGASTREMLGSLIADGLAGNVAAVSSFGAESAVLLHLIAETAPDLPVLFLDTGKHFAETLAYRDLLTARLGLTNLIALTPDARALNARDETGLRWSYDPDGCCEILKVQPLAAALSRYDASFTGRKAFQNSSRSQLPRFEIDRSDAMGRLKINPLIDWSAEDIEAHFLAHDLPRHPLVAKGFPSIGCAPCTHKVAPGEDPRSGRWKGWDKIECGIHTDSEHAGAAHTGNQHPDGSPDHGNGDDGRGDHGHGDDGPPDDGHSDGEWPAGYEPFL